MTSRNSSTSGAKSGCHRKSSARRYRRATAAAQKMCLASNLVKEAAAQPTAPRADKALG